MSARAAADPLEPYPYARKLYPTIRQSVLSSFDSCHLLARFEREYRGGWSYPWQARGQMFHRFAAKALHEMWRQEEPQIEVTVALEILQEVLRQQDVDRVCPHCGSKRIRKGVTRLGNRLCLECKGRFETDFVPVPAHEREQLYWVVKKWAKDNTFDVRNLADVEQRLAARIQYPNPYGGFVERELNGKLDVLMIEGEDAEHAIVLDWKDMWGMPPASAVSEGGFFQQRFYAWLVMRTYRKIERLTLREFYVRWSEPREATIWRHQIDEIEYDFSALVEKFDRAVHERIYTPQPGKHCSFCPTPQKCPIDKNARGEGAIESAEDAEIAAATVVVAEMTLKKRRAALEVWANQHGPVPVRDAKGKRVMGYREQTVTLRPSPEDLERLWQELGRQPTVEEIKRLYRTQKRSKFEAFTPEQPVATESDEEFLASLGEAVESAQVRRAS